VIDVSVVPGAKTTVIAGLHDGALRVRLAAPPTDGRANDALIAWFAERLGMARRDVRILRGTSSRRKQVRVEAGIARVATWLQQELQKLPASDAKCTDSGPPQL
jgi:uncharacterized protein (TIGR00251 family)